MPPSHHVGAHAGVVMRIGDRSLARDLVEQWQFVREGLCLTRLLGKFLYGLREAVL